MKLIDCSIGVLVVSGAISFAIAPVLSLAQSADTFSLFDDLTLTLEQKDRLSQSDTQTRSRLQAILTPTQLTQLEDALESDAGISSTALTALNLSTVQQIELMQILMSTQEQTTDVLTPDQIEHVRRTLPFHP